VFPTQPAHLGNRIGVEAHGGAEALHPGAIAGVARVETVAAQTNAGTKQMVADLGNPMPSGIGRLADGLVDDPAAGTHRRGRKGGDDRAGGKFRDQAAHSAGQGRCVGVADEIVGSDRDRDDRGAVGQKIEQGQLFVDHIDRPGAAAAQVDHTVVSPVPRHCGGDASHPAVVEARRAHPLACGVAEHDPQREGAYDGISRD